MNVLFIGDIVGRAGRRAVRKLLTEVKEDYQPELIIANGENAAGGFGITEKVADELFGYGIDCITMGNHTWNNKDIFNFIEEEPRLLRPLNYMPDVPGHGWTIVESGDLNIAVINFVGQIFMKEVNAPIYIYDKWIEEIKSASDLIIVDFHAEATGEKLAFAHYVDGEVGWIAGTHTHVQTADARILPGGSAYISDLGLTGAVDSILGMKKEDVVEKYRRKLPGRFNVATGQCQLEGAVVRFNTSTGSAEEIKSIHYTD